MRCTSFTRVRLSTSNLSGQVAVLFVFASIILIGFLGLAVDAVGAYRLESRQLQLIELAKDAVSSVGEEIKFSSDPAQTVGNAIANSYKENGGTGKVTVLVYEAPANYSVSGKTLPSNNRMFGMRVTVEQTYKTYFLSMFGAPDFTIKKELVWTLNPYSKSSKVWRPSDSETCKSATYIFENGVQTSSKGFTTIPVPTEVKTSVDKAIAAL